MNIQICKQTYAYTSWFDDRNPRLRPLYAYTQTQAHAHAHAHTCIHLHIYIYVYI